MNKYGKMALGGALLAAFTAASVPALADNQFNKAEQCVIDEVGEIINRTAQTADMVDIYLDPIQEKCEKATGEKVKDPRVLEKGPSNFRAGGTQYIFK